MSGGGGGGLDGVRTFGSARVGAGSTCINLSEERYKHRGLLIGLTNRSCTKSTSLFKTHKYFHFMLYMYIFQNAQMNTLACSL